MNYFALYNISGECIGFIKCYNIQQDLFSKIKSGKVFWDNIVFAGDFYSEAVEVFCSKIKEK